MVVVVVVVCIGCCFSVYCCDFWSFFFVCSCCCCLNWGTGMAQWWQHSPPTNVALIWFPESASHVGWVWCWFSSLLREVFLRVLRFSPLLKNHHFQIPIRFEEWCDIVKCIDHLVMELCDIQIYKFKFKNFFVCLFLLLLFSLVVVKTVIVSCFNFF